MCVCVCNKITIISRDTSRRRRRHIGARLCVYYTNNNVAKHIRVCLQDLQKKTSRRRVERPSAAAAAVVDIFIYLEKRITWALSLMVTLSTRRQQYHNMVLFILKLGVHHENDIDILYILKKGKTKFCWF